ncbi:MAG: STAS/SEC14 domain-containing protein [Gemmatimonadaceae bacterium]
MPVEFEVADGIIVLRMIDVYTPEDIKKALLQALGDSGAAAPVGLLFDVSHSRSLRTRSADDVVAMGYFLAAYADAFAKRVALVGSDDFPFGMMRMAQVTLWREGLAAEVFRDEADARKWLLC